MKIEQRQQFIADLNSSDEERRHAAALGFTKETIFQAFDNTPEILMTLSQDTNDEIRNTVFGIMCQHAELFGGFEAVTAMFTQDPSKWVQTSIGANSANHHWQQGGEATLLAYLTSLDLKHQFAQLSGSLWYLRMYKKRLRQSPKLKHFFISLLYQLNDHELQHEILDNLYASLTPTDPTLLHFLKDLQETNQPHLRTAAKHYSEKIIWLHNLQPTLNP